MAFSALSYHNNASPGEIQLSKFNLFASDTTPKFAIGTRVSLSDGRVFRYAHFGAATTAGLLAAQDISESGNGVTDNIIIASASAVTTTDGLIGNRFIQLTLASISANQFAGGYLHTEDGAGQGYTYRIKRNTATGDPASGDIRLELYDPLELAVTTATDIAISGNMWANLEAAVAGTDEMVVGVTVAVQALDDFGWVQTWGPGSVLCDGTNALGSVATLSDGVAGAVQTLAGGGTDVADAITEPIIGFFMHAGTDTDHVAVYLQICP